MELYKRKNKTTNADISPFWYYDLTDAAGKRHRKSTGTRDKKAAQRVAAEALTVVDDAVQAGPPTPTLAEAVEEYAADLQGQGKPAYRNVRSCQRKLFGLGPRGGRNVFSLDPGKLLSALTERDIASLMTARRAEGAAPGTIAVEVGILRSSAMMAARLGAAVPTIRWRIPRGGRKVRWLTREEWRRVYEALDPTRAVAHPRTGTTWAPSDSLAAQRLENQDLLVALTLCGGRWGEVSRLTTDQILEGNRVRLYGYKTKKERIVPVPPMFSEALGRRKAASEAAGSVYLFPARAYPKGHKSAPKNPYRTTSTTLTRALRAAGCNAPHLVARDGKATVHSLRHTFASWLLQDGMTLSEVQDLVGHTDINQTRIYAHLSKDDTVARATEKLKGITEGLLRAA